jgi:Terminase large subunit, ATPase domain
MIDSFTIDRALTDPALLGAALGDIKTWQTWRVILKAAFGTTLNREESRAFASVAGSRAPPAKRVRELWAVVARRGGKSRMAAALAVYIACFQQHRLAKGETGMVLCLAASQDQAKVVFRYVLAFLESSPILRQEVVNVTRSEITLRNGIVIAVHSNSFRTIRGRTLIACIFDEIAYWRDEASATPDVEVYRAILPSLATTNGMLIGISTPYRKLGLLHQKHKDHFGQDDHEVLVVQGSTATFNPSLSAATIETQRQADPVSGASEWDGVFRDDIASLWDDQVIDDAVEHGRPLELPPTKTLFGSIYKAFCDPSGGVGQDAYTLSICHRDGEQFVCDLVRGTRGRFDPQTVTQEYAALVQQYGVGTVTGDRYASEWVSAAWLKEGISFVASAVPKSEIYRECIPLFMRGLVRLPEHPTLLRESRLLERTVHRGGKDSIDHPRGGHDDYANALCGALRQLSDHLGFDQSYAWVDGVGIGGTDNLTNEERAARRKEEAESFYRARLTSYLAQHGAFGGPFGRMG